MVYHDLNLGSQDTASDGELRECLATSLASGFSTVALTQRPAVQGRLSDSDRLAKWDGLRQPAAPEAGAGSSSAADTSAPRSDTPAALRQLTRLTFQAGEAVECEALASATRVTSSYDLLAVEPTSERALQQACASLDIEIISLRAHERLPFKLRPATLRPALLRGVMFEVCYGPALSTSAGRVMFMSNVQALAHCTRGRNIILSSGGATATDIRTAHALSCLLASILNTDANKASAALACNAAAAIAKGQARRARAALGLPAAPRAAPTAAKAGKKVQASVGYKAGQELPTVPIRVSKQGQQVAENAAPVTGKKRTR